MRIERSRRMKISFPIETCFRFMYQQSYFFGDFSTYTLKYVNKTSHFSNNLYFGHNERRFHSEFRSFPKLRSKFTWFRIDISFRIECSVRNEKWNELDSEWVATQSVFMLTNIIQSPMISTETKWVRSGLKLNPDSCKHPLRPILKDVKNYRLILIWHSREQNSLSWTGFELTHLQPSGF